MTPQERAEYERAKIELMTQKSQLYTAELKGRLEGEAKGKAEVAKNLKDLGVSPDNISKATGLSVQEIKSL